MDYLTNFYKNKCEQLEEQKNYLIDNLSKLFEDDQFDFKNWLSGVVERQNTQQPAATNIPSEKPTDSSMYSKQASDIMQALSDPNHPATQSAFNKYMLFGMLHSLGVHPGHIKALKDLPHNRDLPQ